MWRPERKIKEISLTVIPIILLSLFYFSFAFASEQSTINNESDSIYRYSALENQKSFIALGDDSINLEENNTITDDAMSKLKDVTEKQITSVEKSNNAITAIESVSVLKSFLVGTRLGELKYQMVQMKDEGYILNSLVLDTKNITINDQINILELQQIKVGNFISKQEDKFSLFGWLVRSL